MLSASCGVILIATSSDPDDPIHDPDDPIHDPDDPIHDPDDPIHDPDDPIHDPNDPVHDPNDPVHDPNDPVHDPNNNKTVDQKIIIEMRNNPKITYDELAEMLSVSRATIKRKVNDLSAKGIIKRIGNNRSGYWEILIEDA